MHDNPHIVIEIEKHPDRIIETIYGPFPNGTEAGKFAVTMHDGEENKIKNHDGVWNGYRRYNYIIRELTAPQNA